MMMGVNNSSLQDKGENIAPFGICFQACYWDYGFSVCIAGMGKETNLIRTKEYTTGKRSISKDGETGTSLIGQGRPL